MNQVVKGTDLLAAADGGQAIDLVEEDDGGLAAARLLEEEPEEQRGKAPHMSDHGHPQG